MTLRKPNAIVKVLLVLSTASAIQFDAFPLALAFAMLWYTVIKAEED